MTAYINTFLSRGDEMVIWCEPDSLYLRINLAAGKKRQLDIVLSPQQGDGILRLTIKSLAYNGRQIPGWLRLLAQDALNDILHDTLGHYTTSRIICGQGWLRVMGTIN